VRENCTPGSVRGAPRKGRSYRDDERERIVHDYTTPRVTLPAEESDTATQKQRHPPRARATLQKQFSDIRFWILLCFFVRLLGITNAPLEVGHNWRQTLGTMVIRNFYETEANIFYPRIDIGGDESGITGMEFPLFNYIGYLLCLLFGYQHWYGRLINLVVSSFGLYMFYRLIRDYMKDDRLAFYSTISLIFSLWFAGRKGVSPINRYF
jgi:hypothetical protein